MKKFNSEDSQEIMKQFKSIISSRLEKLNNEKGSDGELYAYSIAVANQRRKQGKEPQLEETMENSRLREMVITALTEKAKPDYLDIDQDGDKEESMKKAAQDKKKVTEGKGQEKAKKLVAILREKIFKGLTDEELEEFKQELALALDMKLNESLNEDLDLGHTDNEPHMIKAELAQIGKYAMELYKMADQFEGEQEVDFPAWWQAKITTAKNMISSAKHYLDFELKEPELDAMVGIASEEGAFGEEMTPQKSQKKGMPFEGMDEVMVATLTEKIRKRLKNLNLNQSELDEGIFGKMFGKGKINNANKQKAIDEIKRFNFKSLFFQPGDDQVLRKDIADKKIADASRAMPTVKQLNPTLFKLEGGAFSNAVMDINGKLYRGVIPSCFEFIRGVNDNINNDEARKRVISQLD
jgi:hypothetical protein